MNTAEYYQSKYDAIILKAKIREEDPFSNKLTYRERHHIIPKCIGGDDSPTNKVYVTHDEHIKLHTLLCKIYPESKVLAKALRAVKLESPERQMRRRDEFIQKCLDYMEGGTV